MTPQEIREFAREYDLKIELEEHGAVRVARLFRDGTFGYRQISLGFTPIALEHTPIEQLKAKLEIWW